MTEGWGQIVLEPQSKARALVIMAKAPRPGLVKTRLARHLPPLIAADLYRCLLDDTLTLARALQGVEVAVMCPAGDVEDLSSSVQGEVRVVAQKGEGLVAGLESVFAHFGGPGRRVIAFNSDSPHLPASALVKAFDMLSLCDLVVGPTDDGGYYLAGAKAEHPTLFADDGMGTKNALQALLTRARNLRLSPGFADTSYDIDELGDLGRLAAELQQFPIRAPRTAEWLSHYRSAVAESFGKRAAQ